MKVMVCHPGHSFSTSDVYDGICAGLEAIGVEVVPFQWDKPLRIMSTLISAGIQLGDIAPDRAEHMRVHILARGCRRLYPCLGSGSERRDRGERYPVPAQSSADACEARHPGRLFRHGGAVLFGSGEADRAGVYPLVYE
jgi:hypothetical protein